MNMFRGIHAQAKSKWIDVIDTIISNKSYYTSPTTLSFYLENQAANIKGIGKNTIYNKFAYILDEQAKKIRGF